MAQKLTILFAPVDAVGHVYACIGIAQVLRDRGHRIVFAISDNWRQKLKTYGFEEEIIELSDSREIEDPAKFWAQVIVKTGVLNSLSPIEKIMIHFMISTSWRTICGARKLYHKLKFCQS
jgi:UDP:flavonoid glycosyltransferase YjiC (YdhE family)